MCRDCFFECFELEVHETIVRGNLFREGQTVAVASSGGKDSTVLGHVLHKLNQKYEYGLNLQLLSIDEGISGYRDDSLEAVKRNQSDLKLPLTILNYKQLYGWTMDEVVAAVGLKSNCTFCGVLRRQALERGAWELKCDVIATGHNADDLAETILMNLLRGDVARLQRSVHAVTGANDEPIDTLQPSLGGCSRDGCGSNCKSSEDTANATIRAIPRCKPFKYTYEKEIVMYAYFKKLDYFSTECVYAPNSYRGHARAFLKDLEAIRPSAIIDIIHSGESFQVRQGLSLPSQGTCERCGHISSQNICKACVMLDGLNRGQPKLGIGKSSKVDIIRSSNHKQSSVCRKDACDCSLPHRKSVKQIRKQQQRQAVEQLSKKLDKTQITTIGG